ncbi:MAG: hypothetical protein HKN29_14685 [Rhodothermales bacterium]|nr:hypothetical protein [Rhodothermales bacterium]
MDISGMTLAQARAAAIKALQGAFGQIPVNVTLSQPRQFYVHVSGAVPVPGRVLSLPVGRVSSALEMAFADTTRTPVTNPNYRPSLRNVSVVHRDGSESRLDLMRYYSAGQVSQNPYLRDGDVIFVPGYDPAYESVFIDGAVPFPGGYDVRPDDNVRSVLQAAGVHEAPLTPTVVRLLSYAGGDERTIPLHEAIGQIGAAIRVGPRDHISVQRPRLPGGTATIEGMVQHPGTYSIEQGRSTMTDLINLAGGLRPEAHKAAAFLERRALPDPTLGMRAEDRSMPTPDLERLMSADTLAILQQLRLTDLDFLSRAYFAQELRTQNRVSVNLEAVLAGSTEPVILRDGDRLFVPRDDNTVFVAGQVIRPGFVLVAEGQTVDYYVQAAGGRGMHASDVYLMRANTGEVIQGTGAMVMSGDVVFVDRAEDLAENAEMQRLVIQEQSLRSDARIRVAQTVVQSIGTLATLVALIVSLTR